MFISNQGTPMAILMFDVVFRDMPISIVKIIFRCLGLFFPDTSESESITIERFWKTLKYGEVYLKDYENPIEAIQGINRYIDKYNLRRPHNSLRKRTPDEAYFYNLYNKEKQIKICG